MSRSQRNQLARIDVHSQSEPKKKSGKVNYFEFNPNASYTLEGKDNGTDAASSDSAADAFATVPMQEDFPSLGGSSISARALAVNAGFGVCSLTHR